MDSKKIILGFIGDIAAGKTTVATYLHNKYDCNSYRFSTMLRDVLDRIYVEKDRSNLQALSVFLREAYGQDILSKVLTKDVKNDQNSIVVVEGIRRPTDVTYLKDLEGFHMVYITAEAKTRWQRLTKRGENPDDNQKTFETFLTDEKAEPEMLIKEISKQAEFTIVNDGTVENLYQKVEEILKKLGHEN